MNILSELTSFKGIYAATSHCQLLAKAPRLPGVNGVFLPLDHRRSCTIFQRRRYLLDTRQKRCVEPLLYWFRERMRAEIKQAPT
jgi:hypothetical protein